MKILIAYDGSECSDSALDDLKLAGLPETVEAAIISIADVWLPHPPENETLLEYAANLQATPQPFKAYQINAKAVTEAGTLASRAQDRIQKMFPSWSVEAQADYGSPAWGIITKAAEIKSDLIVVGSNGRTTVGRFFLGSISNKVLNEANCSVRVARGKVEVDPVPSRVVIGFDGSPGANAAIAAVAARNWREGSEFKLIVATDSLVPTPLGHLIPPVTDWVEDETISKSESLENLVASALQTLKSSGLNATFQILAGNPKQILVEEAESWQANSIFVGANRFGSRVERFLLGSVSAAVAARARCTVEVVRAD